MRSYVPLTPVHVSRKVRLQLLLISLDHLSTGDKGISMKKAFQWSRSSIAFKLKRRRENIRGVRLTRIKFLKSDCEYKLSNWNKYRNVNECLVKIFKGNFGNGNQSGSWLKLVKFCKCKFLLYYINFFYIFISSQ